MGKEKASGVVRVKVDPRYFRPTEVDVLLGNPEKARTKLGASLVGRAGREGEGMGARQEGGKEGERQLWWKAHSRCGVGRRGAGLGGRTRVVQKCGNHASLTDMVIGLQGGVRRRRRSRSW